MGDLEDFPVEAVKAQQFSNDLRHVCNEYAGSLMIATMTGMLHKVIRELEDEWTALEEDE